MGGQGAPQWVCPQGLGLLRVTSSLDLTQQKKCKSFTTQALSPVPPASKLGNKSELSACMEFFLGFLILQAELILCSLLAAWSESECWKTTGNISFMF